MNIQHEVSSRQMTTESQKYEIRMLFHHLPFIILTNTNTAKSSGRNSMSGLTMDYYINIFRNNPERLTTMKELLLKDFRKMESNFFAYAERNDLTAMRAELHKAKPIVFNLRFTGMLALIEKYHEDREMADDFINQLNQELRHCLAELYTFLEAH